MWFNNKHFETKKKKILLDNLYGYILPHAGTSHTHNILKHTLRFQPTKNSIKKIRYILIMYLPSSSIPNVNNEFHEFYVLKNVLKLYYPKKKIIGLNVLNDNNIDLTLKNITQNNTLFILSVDFSHFLNLQKGLEKENCAARALMFKRHTLKCNKVVDDIRTFNKFYELFPFAKKCVLQWIGRSRSLGEFGVGYLSFLIREYPDLTKSKPDGLFVTAYDKNMTSRECLGKYRWSLSIENELIKDVLSKAKTTSRLTNGMYLDIKVSNYTITYLYKENTNISFIRGYHAIQKNSLYLPEVFLEHTFENGKWISKNDKYWQIGDKFNLKYTFDKLFRKSVKYNINTIKNKSYNLFTTEVIHKKII
jgi:hypothetical protein